MLHIDPWSSRQSESLCTGRTSENKRKHSRGWTEMCGSYERIYADGHMRGVSVCQSQFAVTEYLFIAITPRSTLVRSVSTWQGPIYGSNELNSVLKLNEIVWNNDCFGI